MYKKMSNFFLLHILLQPRISYLLTTCLFCNAAMLYCRILAKKNNNNLNKASTVTD